MERICKYNKTKMSFPATEEGKSLEETLREVTTTNEPIEVSDNMIYNEKDAGVDPATDIRTDKFSIAMEACDKFAASEIAKAAEKPLEETKKE